MSDDRKPTIFESKVADLVEDLRSENAQLRKERGEMKLYLKSCQNELMRLDNAKDGMPLVSAGLMYNLSALLAKLEGGKS